MHAPRHVLQPILDTCRTHGTAAAAQLTRSAFERGLLDAYAVPEILLALHRGDLGHPETLAALSPVAGPGDARVA
jgi:hypothetical protein